MTIDPGGGTASRPVRVPFRAPAPARDPVRADMPRRIATPRSDPRPDPRPADAAPRPMGPPAPDRPRPPPPERATIPEPRLSQIDDFVDTTAEARRDTWGGLSSDHDGGARIGQALRGASSLGSLTPEERTHMAGRAADIWAQDGGAEPLREAAASVTGDHQAERALAAAFAAPGRSDAMVETAMVLNGAATVQAFEGRAADLGARLADAPGPARNAVLDAISDGLVPGPAADAVMTSAMLHADPSVMWRAEDRHALSRALATTVNTDQSPYRDTSRDIVAERIDGILADGEARNLLLDPEIQPELRSWALAQIANDPAFNANTLDAGWASDIVSETFACTAIDQYAARGADPQVLGGEALRNTIGQSLGLAPDILPDASETPAAAAAREAAGLDHRYYGDNSAIDAVADRIAALGGDPAKISVVPVSFTSDAFGAATVPVFRIDTADGRSMVVDHTGLEYDSVAEWAAENRLPDAKMTYPAGLDLGSGETVTANTPEVNDTFWEGARAAGDGIAIGAGITAGIIAIAATGGLAAGTALGAGAGVWGIGRGSAELAELHDRGVDITDLSNPEVRGNVIEVAASALSLGAMSAAVRAARAGVSLTDDAARGVAGLQIAATGADAVAVGDQTIQLAQHWDEMDAGGRATGLLNIAFWAGMGAASTSAGGAAITDAFSFARLSNNVRHGTPYPVTVNDALDPGAIRVGYGPEGGRARDITIQTGPGPVDPAMLDLHVTTARQMEAAGGLRDRIAGLTRDGDRPPVGSQAWEAQLQVDLISTEAASIADTLATTAPGPAARDTLEARQRELSDAIDTQLARIEAGAAAGTGFVAAPPRDGNIRRADGSLNIVVAAQRYGEAVATDRPWNWRTEFDDVTLRDADRDLIRAAARDLDLVQTVPYKGDTRYANFQAIDAVITESNSLPPDMWALSNTQQFAWLNNHIFDGVQPPGTTWHHSEIEGRMELVPFGIHNITNHQGGRSPGQWAER